MAERVTRTIFGFCSPGHVSTDFMLSAIRLRMATPDITRFQTVTVGPGVARARNELTESWFSIEEPEDFFLMTDVDMVFTPEMYFKLRDTAIANPDAGAVSGLNVSYRDGHGLFLAGGPWTGEGRYTRWSAIPEGLQHDVCSGAGFLLIRREAIEDIFGDPKKWTKKTIRPWEYWPPNRSEDVSFAWRLHKGGWPVIIDPDVAPGHIKSYTFGLKDVQR
jgi:GT2 family glycosyltransferase